jgi:hypothetical protein
MIIITLFSQHSGIWGKAKDQFDQFSISGAPGFCDLMARRAKVAAFA